MLWTLTTVAFRSTQESPHYPWLEPVLGAFYSWCFSMMVTAANSSLPAFQWCQSHLSHPSTNTYSKSTNARKNKLLKYWPCSMEWSRESPEKSSSAAFYLTKITHRAQRVEYLPRPQWRDLIFIVLLPLSSEGRRIKTPPQVDREVWMGPNVEVRQLTTKDGAGVGGGERSGAKKTRQAFCITQWHSCMKSPKGLTSFRTFYTS